MHDISTSTGTQIVSPHDWGDQDRGGVRSRAGKRLGPHDQSQDVGRSWTIPIRGPQVTPRHVFARPNNDTQAGKTSPSRDLDTSHDDGFELEYRS